MIGGLEFKPEEHGYYKDGVKVPSVSKILEYIYPDPNKQWYKPEHVLRGQYVHTITELLDEDNLDWSTLDPALKPYADAYSQFLLDEKPEWSLTEEMVFNEQLWYAGRLDRAEVLRVDDCILDIKTGSAGRNVKHGMQTAAYHMALTDEKRKRWVLYLRNTGKYSLFDYTDPDDYNVVKHGAWLFNWSRSKGIIK